MRDSFVNGEIGERAFSVECLKRKINLYTPIIDTGCDSVIIKPDGSHLRIQIKTTSTKTKDNINGYESKAKGFATENKAYGKIDFFVFYILPMDLFYIVPSHLVKSKITLHPTNRNHKFDQYRNAFYLLE